MKKSIAALFLIGCLVPACSAAPPTTPAAAQASASVSVFTDGDWLAVGYFVDDVLAKDIEKASALVSAGSPASRYMTFQRQFEDAGGTPAAQRMDRSLWKTTVDKTSRVATITFTDGRVVKWSDWEFDASGKITQWSTPNGGRLTTRLWSAQPSSSVGDATVKLTSAMKSDVMLNVVLEVTAGAKAVTPDCKALYPDAAGKDAAAAFCGAPASIPAGTTAKVLLEWSTASFGKTMTYALKDGSGAVVGTAKLAVT